MTAPTPATMQPTPRELARLRAGVAAEQAAYYACVENERIAHGTDRAYALPSCRGPRVEYLRRVTAWRERIARGKRAAKAQYEHWRACEAKREKQNARNRAKYAARKSSMSALPAAETRRGGIRSAE